MSRHPFVVFGAHHLAASALVCAAIAAVTGWAARGPRLRAERAGRALALVLLAYYPLDAATRVLVLGEPAVSALPLELCGLLFLLGPIALWTAQPDLLAVLFLVTFAGTLHSLITPTPADGFPSLEFVRYFTSHGLLVLAACYARFALGAVPTVRHVLLAFAGLQCAELAVGAIDAACGLNFMYLRRPPPSPTLFDLMGPWPLYLASMEVVAMASLVLWWALSRALARAGTAPAVDRRVAG